ncbi:nuclear pore complex protein Nup85-like [Lineus longissimus]|uniref:nuclear pore complex protein Nup85-like n=1 Tax=Lineus longissimus TaxID=88925 RepID=UPI002B4E3D6A
MAADRNSEVPVTVIEDDMCRVGMKPVWGFGNQLFTYASAGSISFRDEPSGVPCPGAQVHEVKWATDMHNDYTRKLVNESHNIFMSLQQSHQPDTDGPGSSTKPHLLKVSRHYRSVIKACIMDLQNDTLESTMDEVQKNYYENQIQLLDMIELIWSLCEILFIDSAPGGMVLLQLLDWLKWHFTEGDKLAASVMRDEHPSDHDQYWPAVYCYLLQGRVEETRKLLSAHSQHNTETFRCIDELLRKMPIFKYFTGQSLAEFDLRWRHWQDECESRLDEQFFITDTNLELVCRILCGQMDAFKELQGFCEPWYHMLISMQFYQNPTVKVFELQHYAQESIDVCAGNALLAPLDSILLAALEFDIHQVIKESSTHLSNWWFVAHLTDLLHHCGQLELQKLNFGSNLREYLLLDYASSLMSHSSLWQIGADYFDHCPEFGRHYLQNYLEHIPLETEKKALKVYNACEKRGMHEQVISICKVMSMTALRNKRLGTALTWCLKCKDVSLATYLSQKFLDEYSEHGSFIDLDLIDNLGSTMLLSNRLTFLGKYREFHRLYEEGEFHEAARLLLSLLTAKLAHRKFWLTLLTDALPLLEADEVIFNSQQTYELMHCLTEIRLALKLDEKSGKKVAKSEEQDTSKLDIMKLALARNLARADILEGSIIS